MSARTIDGQVLTLSASGWTYHNRFVLYDYETESLWFCLDGSCTLTCISGVFADKALIRVFSSLTTWNEWKSLYLNSKYLQYPPGNHVKREEPPPIIRRD